MVTGHLRRYRSDFSIFLIREIRESPTTNTSILFHFALSFPILGTAADKSPAQESRTIIFHVGNASCPVSTSRKLDLGGFLVSGQKERDDRIDRIFNFPRNTSIFLYFALSFCRGKKFPGEEKPSGATPFFLYQRGWEGETDQYSHVPLFGAAACVAESKHGLPIFLPTPEKKKNGHS